MREFKTGEIWIDRIDGLQVMTVKDSNRVGCKACAFATSAGGFHLNSNYHADRL